MEQAVTSPIVPTEVSSELDTILTDASAALARLDADRLEALSLRALAIGGQGQSNLPTEVVPELTARLRVFAAAMQATRDNFDFMEALAHQSGCVTGRGGAGGTDGSGAAGVRRGFGWDR